MEGFCYRLAVDGRLDILGSMAAPRDLQELTELAKRRHPNALQVLEDFWNERGRPDIAEIWRFEPRKLVSAEQAIAWVVNQVHVYGMSTQPADRPLFEAAVCSLYHLIPEQPAPQIVWLPHPGIVAQEGSRAGIGFAPRLARLEVYRISHYVNRTAPIQEQLLNLANEALMQSNLSRFFGGGSSLSGEHIGSPSRIIDNMLTSLYERYRINSAESVESAFRRLPLTIRSFFAHHFYMGIGQFEIFKPAMWTALSMINERQHQYESTAHVIKCMLAICRSASYWWPSEGVVFVSERPRKLVMTNSAFHIEWEGLTLHS
jgi:hypothetical protein